MPSARGEGLSIWATVEITGMKEEGHSDGPFYEDREMVNVIFSLFQELANFFL